MQLIGGYPHRLATVQTKVTRRRLAAKASAIKLGDAKQLKQALVTFSSKRGFNPFAQSNLLSHEVDRLEKIAANIAVLALGLKAKDDLEFNQNYLHIAVDIYAVNSLAGLFRAHDKVAKYCMNKYEFDTSPHKQFSEESIKHWVSLNSKHTGLDELDLTRQALQPIELAHFIKLGYVLAEYNATPLTWVTAQFEQLKDLSFLVGQTISPSVLVNESSYNRYLAYRAKL